MPDEVAVTLHNHSSSPAQAPATDLANTLFLAGIGALALARDTAQQSIEQMKARGLTAKQQGEAAVGQVAQALPLPFLQASSENGLERASEGLSKLLHRFNIPSKRDIDDLNARIDQLNQRISQLQEESRKNS
jgi:poly(hydroxyalkanoate) granule-associated protein